MSDFLVVCVDAQQRPMNTEKPPLTEGCIYTVVGFEKCFGMDSYILAEVVNSPIYLNRGFAVDRFRPVRATDISALTALLNTAPSTVDA